jgi:protein tyrosine phosphatase
MRRNPKSRDEEMPDENEETTKVKSSHNCVPLSAIVDGNVKLPPEEEFDKLVNYEDTLGQRITTAQGLRYNKIGMLNMHPTVLPFDHNRVRLRNEIDGVDYINASWMTQKIVDEPTYDQVIYSSHVPYDNIKFLVSQDPLPTTAQHHFSMMHEHKIDMVVNIAEDAGTKPMKVGKTYHFQDIELSVDARNKISDHLSITEFRLFNTTAPRSQYMQHVVFFECTAWPTGCITSSEQTKDFVSSILQIRSQMKLDNDSIKLLLHDSQGGLGSSAAFLALYDLIQKVDESFNDNNELKRTVKKIDVFGTVNRLRKDRAGMISDYETYTLLFKSLEHYGANRIALTKTVPMKFSSKTAPVKINIPSEVTRKIKDDTMENDSDMSGEENEIEYVMEENSDNDEQDPFEDYYEGFFLTSPTYQNITDMSEYLN